MPFMDDVPMKLEWTRYQAADGSYKMIPENLGICCFIWNHCIVINHILQCLQNVGATISMKKFILAAPDMTIIGHKCTLEGAKDVGLAGTSNVTQVHGFLGVCRVVCIFIKYFTKIASLLVNITWKGVLFIWDDTHQIAMEHLKDKIAKSHTPSDGL
ncbi:hypothetical protein PAXRUDRAFT_161327 [Paxillus rubicundulus Ve08.2h10]|uniref:Uncharacterized protein n=1 Tax=Paxillus rubicundulus Ve08.2h10 TaxID=930991 RepID=A0A0D0D6Z4_9AGAM|nr:hypothetical protein PAXRUDRAFT_161327 [Paxillus rubicundulus Ve08.2h10]